ncbi:hypothetical protein FNV43_RR15288 [Rhamnella rubrinervis]|uniref:Disease resistance RPP13-like protein 1 n=1 Tax=Rhamnella rubrinervis TaxID=2594499 RepID=A0A8K0E8I3_9ROSA|nr:hypothetical protein FNV43_RR15288 [Rhamnella rubrinervis]
MALEVVGGALLSASLQVLFADIHSIVDFVRPNKEDGELLNQLRNKLLLANGVLDDAERQQITKPDVREWLEQLKDAIQFAEDLVDDIKTEALRCQLEADRQMGCLVCNFFSYRFAVKDVERRIQNIIKSVVDIVKDMNRLGLRDGVQTSIPFQIQRSSQNILAKKSNVHGRDAEKETILKFLKSDSGHKFSVMPIVGMGGIGKTTLAQLVYTDVIDGALVLEKPFDINTWITVADESKSDVLTLTKAIYEKVTKSTHCTDVKETFELQRKLKEALQGKKFLFILDDVWNVDHEIWDGLQTPFESAANGSKIIVTTRLSEIAKVLVTVDSKTLDLPLLSEADCWLLFSKHAFNNVEPSSYPHLVEIGKKIVEKCGGNPLAVGSLACLLHSQLDPKKWENVLVNDIWELDQGKGGILPALWLSYYYLPRRLKRCFAYCSIIPKDYSFGKEQLIMLWMAEGLLQPKNNMMLEEVGEEYFEDLTSRSFFHVDEHGEFTMHDLVNDLAKFVSGESCLRLDDNCSENLTRKTRHISLMNYATSDIRKKLEDLSKNTGLRTLFLLKDCSRHLLKQLRSMKYLRVLSFGLHGDFEGQMKLLKSIGRLKHLRYLDLSCNEGIKEIPESIGKLCNLQTLLLRFCRNLHQLPESIVNLKHLRYLDLSDTRIEKIPEILGNLHELRTLNLFRTRIEKIPDILDNLHELRRLDLSRTRIEKIPEILGNLHELHTLDLSRTRIEKIPEILGNLHELRTLDLSRTQIEKIPEILGNLHELRILNLSSTRIEKIPDIFGNLHKLHILDLSGTRIEKIPDTLGNLHKLHTLNLSDTPIEKIPDTLGNLHELRTLNLFDTPIEKIPDTLGNLHELRTLFLSDCVKLTQLPTTITMLTNLCDLDNSGTSLKEMPPKISNLKNLQCLPEFVVGKSCGIEELGKLTNLHGHLRIRSLENVEEVGVGVVLKNKNHITDLELEWNDGSTDVSHNKAREVLDRLQPHANIERLKIINYGGRSFPDWMGHHSFSCIKDLRLYRCKNCGWLPPLGELPSLEVLEIKGFDTVERIGNEFYLNDSSSSSSRVTEPPFKSLKCLRFESMGEWKEWSLVGGAFPILKRLELRRCPKLKGAGSPYYLPSLNVIDNDHVGRLSEEGCTFPNLKSLEITGCGKLFAHGNKLGMFTSLTFLHMYDVDMNGLDSFPEKEGQLPTTLTSLELISLRGLKSLNGTALRHLTSLERLYIQDCQQLQCLPEEGLPTSLFQLYIYGFMDLGNWSNVHQNVGNHAMEMHLTRSRRYSFASVEKLRNPTVGSDNKLIGCPRQSCACIKNMGKKITWEGYQTSQQYLQNSKCTGSVLYLPELPLIDLHPNIVSLLGFGAVLGQHLLGYYVRKLSFDDALNRSGSYDVDDMGKLKLEIPRFSFRSLMRFSCL